MRSGFSLDFTRESSTNEIEMEGSPSKVAINDCSGICKRMLEIGSAPRMKPSESWKILGGTIVS